MVTNHSPEALISQLFDALPDGVTYLEPLWDDQQRVVDFQVVYINAEGRAIAGANYKNGVGTRVRGDNAHDRVLTERIYQQCAEVFETGQEQEFVYQHPNGNRYVTVSRKKVGNGVLSVVRDCNRQYELETQQRQLLDGILNASLDGIAAYRAVADESGQITGFAYHDVNRSYRRMAGLTSDGELPAFPGPMETELVPLFRQVIETGEPRQTVIANWVDPLNSWYEVVAVQFDHGLVATFHDITESWQTELLNNVVKHIPAGIIVAEALRDAADQVADFQVILVNEAALEWLKLSCSHVIDHTVRNLNPRFESAGLLDACRQTLATGDLFQTRYLDEASGRWVELAVSRMDADTVIGILADVTPNQQAHQQLEVSVSDLQRSNQNLEQFAFVASHDLQEPLRKIVSFGDILANQYAPELGPEGADIVGRMQSAASRMQHLVRDVLAYSRLTADEGQYRLTNMDHLMQDVLVDLETRITDKQAIVEVEGMNRLRGDAPQLRQLFQNLISNALKFTRPGVQPRITITCRTLAGHESGMPLSPTDHDRQFDLIEVTDNGIGFEPHQAGQIFQVFHRLHGRNAYQGTGIGLAIVQKVVENHRGYVVAEGRPGEGATFRVLLPTATDE